MTLAVLLAGCATYQDIGGTRSVEVTRFHLGQPVPRGEIAVEAFEPAGNTDLEFRAHASAIARQLAAQGWTVVDHGQSEQVALVDVRHGSRGVFAPRSPVSFGIGGFTGGRRSAFGLGANFAGSGTTRELVGTMLEVRIKRRADGTTYWEGRAVAEAPAGSIDAERAIVIERLSEALFRDFPGESGRTIRAR